LHNNAASFYERDCPKKFIYIKMSSEADEKLTPCTKKPGTTINGNYGNLKTYNGKAKTDKQTNKGRQRKTHKPN
jgi:hypothetical protein